MFGLVKNFFVEAMIRERKMTRMARIIYFIVVESTVLCFEHCYSY